MHDDRSDQYFNRPINLRDIRTFLYYLTENAVHPVKRRIILFRTGKEMCSF